MRLPAREDPATPMEIRPTVAGAILQQNGCFLMQLRDDNPKIIYPGHWAFFGGHLEPGETPEVGVRRELLEEIGHCPQKLTLFRRSEDLAVIRYVFSGHLDVDLTTLQLNEGMDLALLTVDDIVRGDRYSQRIQQVRPLGKPHQQLLLDFIQHSAND